MLRYLALLLAILWIIPRLLRLLGGASRKPGRGPERVDGGGARSRRGRKRDQRLQNLTQQDISDADFEEIPPEE